MTPALILRALLSGNLAMFEAALCELSGKGSARVAGLARSPDGLGFTALYESAGLPDGLLPVFRAGLVAMTRRDAGSAPGIRLDRHMVDCAIAACAMVKNEEAGALTALLRRFEAEAARDEVQAGREMGPSGVRSAVPAVARDARRTLPPRMRAAA